MELRLFLLLAFLVAEGAVGRETEGRYLLPRGERADFRVAGKVAVEKRFVEVPGW